jgi:hypothetical protein
LRLGNGWQAATSPEDLQREKLMESPHVSRIFDLERASTKFRGDWPGFEEAHRRHLSVELGPGDALYIPCWWLHKTYSLEAGTVINWWFAWQLGQPLSTSTTAIEAHMRAEAAFESISSEEEADTDEEIDSDEESDAVEEHMQQKNLMMVINLVLIKKVMPKKMLVLTRKWIQQKKDKWRRKICLMKLKVP